MRHDVIGICAMFTLALAGCDDPTPQGDGSTHPPTLTQEQPAGTLSPEDVNLSIVDGEQFQAVIEKHRGSVLLIDYWAIWCQPCKENFPHIVQLHNQHADDGLAVVSLSMDFPDDEPAVRRFLADQQADFENLLSKFGASSDSAETYDFDGGVPLYKLYDREGNLRYQFSEFPDELAHGEPVENIDRRVEELLNETPAE